MAGIDIRPIETHVLGLVHDSAQCIKNLLLSDRTRLGDAVHLVAVVTRADAELDIHSEAVSLVRTVKIEVQIARREGNNQVDAMRMKHICSAWHVIAPFTLERTCHMTPLVPRRFCLRAAMAVNVFLLILNGRVIQTMAFAALAIIPLLGLPKSLCRCPGVAASIVSAAALGQRSSIERSRRVDASRTLVFIDTLVGVWVLK